jgi:acyl-CoA thioesterase II
MQQVSRPPSLAKMESKFAQTFTELAGVREIAPNRYESLSFPERMANSANIAYGGCALAVAITAAHASLPSTGTYRLYSATGSYLGPSLTDRILGISVRKLRDTKVFATRQVEVFQTLDDWTERMCMFVLADFQQPEPRALLTYSVKPALPLIDVESALSSAEQAQRLVENGVLHPKLARLRSVMFALGDRHFDTKPHPDGVMAQNSTGMAKAAVTSQDSLPLTSKLSSDYIKSKQKMQSPGDNMAALAFLLDGALSFVPLSHDHKFIDDAGACSSLEFALRVFSNNIDINRWKLRELGTIVGGEGRTYSEGRLWDEDKNLIANMTQQCILRPLPEKKSNAKL